MELKLNKQSNVKIKFLKIKIINMLYTNCQLFILIKKEIIKK